jgi:hypothetical protein
MHPKTVFHHCRSRCVIAALAALTLAAPTDAEAQRAPEGARPTMSALIGGMAVGESRLLASKLSVELGRWALVGDITRDAATERWTPSASSGDYLLWGFSGAVRRYTRTGGRGTFLEASAGVASLRFRVTEADGRSEQRNAEVTMMGWGLGHRFDIPWGKTFLELAYRANVPMRTTHLYVDDTPPDVRPREPISERSWYLGRGQATGQLYLGVGLHF